MFTNLDKYVDWLEMNFENLHCELFKERTHRDGCHDCSSSCKECIKENIKWLLEEYKGDILSEKERDYITKAIAPYRHLISSICKYDNAISGKNVVISQWKNSFSEDGEDLGMEETPFMIIPITEEMPFKMLEINHRYGVKGLRL